MRWRVRSDKIISGAYQSIHSFLSCKSESDLVHIVYRLVFLDIVPSAMKRQREDPNEYLGGDLIASFDEDNNDTWDNKKKLTKAERNDLSSASSHSMA